MRESQSDPPASPTSTDTLHHAAGRARRASNTSCEFIVDTCRTVTTFAVVFAIQRCAVSELYLTLFERGKPLRTCEQSNSF